MIGSGIFTAPIFSGPLSASFSISAAVGAFALSGKDAGYTRPRRLTANTGVFVWTGGDSSLSSQALPKYSLVSFFDAFWHNVFDSDMHLVNDDFKIMLVNNYVFDHTDESLIDIGSVELPTGNGYTAGGQSLENVTFAYDNGYTTWDADDPSWPAIGGPIGVSGGAIIYDNTTPDKKLVCYIDFITPKSANGGNAFNLGFSPAGIFRVAA